MKWFLLFILILLFPLPLSARPCDPDLQRWEDEEDVQERHYSTLEGERGRICSESNYSGSGRPWRFSDFFRGRRRERQEPDASSRRSRRVVAVDCSDRRNETECGCVRNNEHPDCEDIFCGETD